MLPCLALRQFTRRLTDAQRTGRCGRQACRYLEQVLEPEEARLLELATSALEVGKDLQRGPGASSITHSDDSAEDANRV